jgi:pimeloyl-ACP methyl ester carboxylesterase
VPPSPGTPVLASTVIAGEPPGARILYVLHGIFGRGKNWGAVARHLQVRRPDWQSVLIDLRLHGDSPAFEAPHTIDACAADVSRLEGRYTHEPRAVLGHSFGGKVALRYATRAGARLQVWVVDSTPDTREPSGVAWEMLQLIRSLPAEFDSRHQAIQAMQQHGVQPGVASWMASNLRLEDGHYRWRLDMDAVGVLLEDFFRADLWTVVEQPPPGVELHFVKARESHTLDEDACERIRDASRRHGRAHLHLVAGGHWVNTDNPEAILGLLATLLPRN